jgi:hypothetical protein
VIGVFALCSLALLTFFVSDFNVSNSFVALKVIKKINAAIDEHAYYKEIGVPQIVNEGYFKIVERNSKKYFHYEKISMDFNMMKFRSEETLLFSVEYPVPQ